MGGELYRLKGTRGEGAYKIDPCDSGILIFPQRVSMSLPVSLDPDVGSI